MIDKAVNLIITQLNQYIPNVPPEVVVGNIALNESPDQTELQEKIVVSVVNIEEESTLKNANSHNKSSGGIQYLQPPVYLNLYILFSSNYPKSYDNALKRLSEVIVFFQNRKTFDINSSLSLPAGLDEDALEMTVTLDLFTMSFEQSNHLWGTLGGKQMPFVMYKARLVKLQERKVFKEAPLIEEIHNHAISN